MDSEETNELLSSWEKEENLESIKSCLVNISAIFGKYSKREISEIIEREGESFLDDYNDLIIFRSNKEIKQSGSFSTFEKLEVADKVLLYYSLVEKLIGDYDAETKIESLDYLIAKHETYREIGMYVDLYRYIPFFVKDSDQEDKFKRALLDGKSPRKFYNKDQWSFTVEALDKGYISLIKMFKSYRKEAYKQLLQNELDDIAEQEKKLPPKLTMNCLKGGTSRVLLMYESGTIQHLANHFKIDDLEKVALLLESIIHIDKGTISRYLKGTKKRTSPIFQDTPRQKVNSFVESLNPEIKEYVPKPSSLPST